ncbi:MAG: GNAT family N-acetyltransferase [Oscillospiraceae bacterium]|nr:GNAT family N-acetyltransferase [Oscillospiraceae bacterium]
MKTWDVNEKQYDMQNGYFLIKADFDLFIKNFIIYSTHNMWLFDDFKNMYDKITQSEKETLIDKVFWIEYNDVRIGGAVISPKNLYGCFLIPPFENRYIVFDKLNKLLSAWSEKGDEITVRVSSHEEKNVFISLGYKIQKERCVMIRPTDKYEIIWDNEVNINIPDTNDIDKLAHFFINAHIGSSDDKGQSQEAFDNEVNQLKYFFNIFENNGSLHHSCFVRDKLSSIIIGACIAGKDDGEPYEYTGIVDVAVLPEYRGRNIARNMIKYTMTTASDTCSAITLGVTIGNDAQSLYTKLGFVSGSIFTTLTRTC